MIENICSLIDQDGRQLARLSIEDHQEGWYYAKVVWHAFPEEIHKALK
jgi:bifunctional DNase/RNase